MPTPQTVIPQLRVTSADVALVFYVQGLGFAVDWQHRFAPGLPLFLQVTRRGQTLFLSEHAGDGAPGGVVYFRVPDVDACHREFVERGVALATPPRDMPWGAREMAVLDPDGNRLRFAGPLAAPPTP